MSGRGGSASGAADPAPEAVSLDRWRRRRTTTSVVLGVLALLLTVPATVALARDDDGLTRTTATADGLPVTLLVPDDGAPRPGVLVVHGFSGSAQLMDGVGLALARAGYAVGLVDLDGHGDNPRPLRLETTVADPAQLDSDVAAAVDWLAAQPQVSRGPLALVGHSMGAGAVVRYAAADAGGARRIGATVAISLPDGDDVPAGDRAAPRDLLLLWGAAELPRFSDAGLEALQRGYPGATTGVTYGDAAAGTARRADVVPGVEHVSILFSGTTLDDTVGWLDEVYADASGLTSPGFDTRVLWLVVLLVGASLGFVPLARLAYGDRPAALRTQEPSARAAVLPVGWALAIGVGSAAAATMVPWLLPAIGGVLPVAVGGYVWVWFGSAGLLAGVVAWVVATRRRGRPLVGPPSPTSLLRPVLATLAMTSYAVAVLVLSGRATWSPFGFVGDRTWLVPVMDMAFLAYFWADERLAARPRRGVRLAVAATNRAVGVALILAATAVLGAPGFLVLLLPVMVLLYVLLGAWAHVVAGLTHERWAPAVLQAVPLAYLVATTFPLVG